MLTYLESSNQLLQKRGYRLTPQRSMILRVLQEADGHLTIDQVLENAKQFYPHMNLSTIYRTIDLLREVGLIREIHIPGEALQYEVMEQRTHHHLFCRRCRTLLHLDHDLLGNLPEYVQQRYQFHELTLDLLVAGYCEKCWHEMKANSMLTGNESQIRVE